MKTYIIYKYKNLINNKVYIGLTSETLHKRNLSHLRKVRFGSTSNFHQDIRKHGIENFELIEIDTIITSNKKEAYQLEQFYIDKFEAYNKGYNMDLFGWNISDKSGKNNPMYDKISGNAHKCSIKGIVYDSVTDAGVKLNVNRGTINRWIKSKKDCFKIQENVL